VAVDTQPAWHYHSGYFEAPRAWQVTLCRECHAMSRQLAAAFMANTVDFTLYPRINHKSLHGTKQSIDRVII
jgi:hypothetical protein